jgi:hypothetical protein
MTLEEIKKLNMSSGIKEVLTDVLNFWFFWYIYLTLRNIRCKFVKDLTLIGNERYSVVKSKKKFTNYLTERKKSRKFVKQIGNVRDVLWNKKIIHSLSKSYSRLRVTNMSTEKR